MLTKSGKLILASCADLMGVAGTSSTGGNFNNAAYIPVRIINGDKRYANRSSFSSSDPSGGLGILTTQLIGNGYENSQGVGFGSGDAVESEDSYALQTPITGLSIAYSGSGYPIISATGGIILGNKIISKWNYGIQNNNESAVTIKEIGLFRCFYVTDTLGGSPGSKGIVMVDRTVLETPITIPAGGYKTITYQWEYDYTNFLWPSE